MHTTPAWSTSSFGTSAAASVLELSSLRSHIGHCRSVRGPLFHALCLADAVGEFLGNRIITTLVVTMLAAVAVMQLS